MARWPLGPVSLREEGAGLPKAQALRSGGFICSSSSATNLHGRPSLSLCLLVHKTGLTVAPHRIVERAERDGVRGPDAAPSQSPTPHPIPVGGGDRAVLTTPTSICSWAPLKGRLRLGRGSADWGQPGGGRPLGTPTVTQVGFSIHGRVPGHSRKPGVAQFQTTKSPFSTA